MKHLLAVFAILSMFAGAARAGQASCDDVMQRGHLNVLTINILYTDFSIAWKGCRPLPTS
jgi:hypothetical protein